MLNQPDIAFDFTSIDYLKTGNERQKNSYKLLVEYKILTFLQKFDPILVGTIPINIDIESSDLDIICYSHDRNEFVKCVENNFSNFKDFYIRESHMSDREAVIAGFNIDNFEIEIFCQDIPTQQQNAYRHMLIEYKILCEKGEAFRQKIIDLKQQGYKTEPAFAIMLGLTGDPYLELLKYQSC